MNDVSFDLETLGTSPDSLILSIGAVRFDRKTGKLQLDEVSMPEYDPAVN